jgi:hypothetical protein
MQPAVHVVITELDGPVQGCVDLGRRIIWLDSQLSPVEQKCVLAYEIGQLLHGPLPEDPCAAAAHRRDCEEWAALRLIPVEALLDAFRMFRELPAIAAWLDVDDATLRTRLRCLTDAEQDAVMAAIYSVYASG